MAVSFETRKAPVSKKVASAMGIVALAGVTKGHLNHQEQKITKKDDAIRLEMASDTWTSGSPVNKLTTSSTGQAASVKVKPINSLPAKHCVDRFKTSSTVQGKVFYFYEGKGLTPAQAAGWPGNFQQESGLNPDDPGGGLANWGGTRWEKLQELASREHRSPTDVKVQLDYSWLELTNGRGAGEDDSSVLRHLKGTHTAADAAAVISNEYERPGIPALQNRINYADNALHKFGHLARIACNARIAVPSTSKQA